MIILSRYTCTRVDTKNILCIEYDCIARTLYAIATNGQVSERVILVQNLDKYSAWMIINSMAKQESLGDKIFQIKSYQDYD